MYCRRVPRPQLIGRDQERSRLAGLLGDSPAGPVLILRGEAGIGKTALLADLAAAASGYRVLRAAGAEAEHDLPFAGLHQLLHPLLADTGRLDPQDQALIQAAFSAGPAPAAPPVMALGIAVLELLTLVSAGTPLLLIVDDGHWLDPQSTQLLAFVARRLTGSNVRLVIALRTEVASLMDRAGLPELVLDPLTEQAAGRLLDQHRAGLHPHHRRVILQAAAGNPLALMELPRAPAADSVGDSMGTVTLTRRLEQVYGGRLREMPAEECGALLRAALDGTGSGSGRYRMHDVPAALEAGLLIADPASGELVFRHPLVRSAVIQNASPDERRAAHAELARLYEDESDRRAVHLAAATVEPDEAVASDLEAAAASATRRGGTAIAVTWLTRAAELSRDPAERSRRLAEAAYLAGQSGALQRAQDLTGPAGAGDPAAVVNDGYVTLYRDGDVLENHWRIIALLEAGPPDQPLTERALNLLLPISQFAADPAKWALTDALIDRYGDQAGPSTTIARDVWGDVLTRGHGVPKRIAHALADPDKVKPADAARLLVCASYLGVLNDHRSFLRRMIERESESGAVTNVMVTLQLVMLDQVATGAWEEAERTGLRGLQLTSEHGYQLFAHTYQAYLGLLAAHRGDLSRARELQVMVDAWGRPRGVGFLTEYAEVIGASAALSEGDYESAYSYLSGITTPGTFTRYSQHATRTVLDLVEAAWHTGRHEAARAHALAAQEARLADLSPRLGLLTAGALAITAPADQAGDLFTAALARPAAASWPFEQARIRLAHGAWLRRLRDQPAARPVLSSALETFEKLGAAAWAERTRAELRAAGRPSRVDRAAVATLTPQERQIAEMAATGLSNREIGARLYLSPRTVGAHLYKIFPKLGITTRASLRDALQG